MSGQGTSILCLRANPTSFPSSGSVGVKVSNACGASNVMIPVNYAFQGNCSSSFAVFPNPGTDIITVEQSVAAKGSTLLSTKINEVEIIDKMGKVHYKRKFPKGLTKVNIPVSSLPNDVYTLQVFDGRTWYSHKVIVQH